MRKCFWNNFKLTEECVCNIESNNLAARYQQRARLGTVAFCKNTTRVGGGSAINICQPHFVPVKYHGIRVSCFY